LSILEKALSASVIFISLIHCAVVISLKILVDGGAIFVIVTLLLALK